MRLVLLVLLALIGAPFTAAEAACGRLLVSGYVSNIHVYDACSGEFQQVLDQASPRRLAGAQATRIHDGLIYVVSENTQQILRYRADTLAFVDVFIETGPINPTGVDVGPDGDVYVGGYQSDSVLRFDGGSGAAKGTVVAARAAGLNGADNGLGFGPDGKLYVPGYDSNNAVRYDPSNGQTSEWIAARAGGLRHTRAILFEPNGSTALVASEGSDTILRFRISDGGLVGTFANPGFRPTGLDYGENGELLVTGDQANLVRVLNPSSGAFVRDLVSAGAGGLRGATFVTYLPAAAPVAVDPAHLGSQFWIVGAGLREGRVVQIDDAFSSSGTGFGSQFDPAQLTQRRWGALQLRWTGCDQAELSWSSSSSDSAGFGDGGYSLQRLAPNPAGQACQSVGFEQVSDGSYMSGTWFGGAERNGEGLFVDALSDGLVLVSFFTHRPLTVSAD